MNEKVAVRVLSKERPEEALLQYLAARQLLDGEGAARVQRAAVQSKVSISKILLELGLVPERDLIKAFEESLGLAVAKAEDYPIEPVLPDAISERFLREQSAIVLSAQDKSVRVAVADPLDTYLLSALSLSTGRSIEVVVAPASEIEQALNRVFESGTTHAMAAAETSGDVTEADLARLRESASEAPTIRFVNSLIAKAVEAGASDIHIEPFERKLRIRLRIDGVLKEEEPAPVEQAAGIISRLKIVSGLNIAERRLPQDGAMKMPVKGREIDFRVATAPVAHGECAVVRILDKSAVPLDLSALGFSLEAQSALDGLLARPNGIILVTGPTGSGKTTTLYSALMRLNSSERKILSVEDPVEYKIPGVNQIQVKPEIGLTFAHVLRSVLRHDPDVILVGEIRDGETARIAVQAALTGHIVLSTVHTNSAAAAITRLLDMGAEDYLLTSTIAGIVSQRLVRLLCPQCKAERPLTDEWQAELRDAGMTCSGQERTFAANGCAACNQTGYKGRSVISEILIPDDRIRRLIVEKAGSASIHAAAVEKGMESLRRNGLRKVLEGLTTFEEVSRVAQNED